MFAFEKLPWHDHRRGRRGGGGLGELLRRMATRVHYTLVVVAALAFLWFLNYWNLPGRRY